MMVKILPAEYIHSKTIQINTMKMDAEESVCYRRFFLTDKKNPEGYNKTQNFVDWTN